MNQKDLDSILKDADEVYDGELDVAIAAHLMGDVVIIRSGGVVPAGADYPRIAEIKKEALAREKALEDAKAVAIAAQKQKPKA